MPLDQIEKLNEQMVKDAEAIRFNAQKMSWYMRGGMTYTDILNMSPSELENINKIIEENLETTKKSRLPFF